MKKSKSCRKSKRLFKPTGNLSDVVLNWYGRPGEKLDQYAQAFHLAAKTVVAKSSSDDLRDIGACPVVFLYRHALELFLKDIFITGSKILWLEGKVYKSPSEVLEMGHDLKKLLDETKTLFSQLDWAWDSRLEECREAINEFYVIDSGSFNFRYPVKKSGDPALPNDFRFDLRNFSSQMDDLLDYLLTVNCGLAGTLGQMESI